MKIFRNLLVALIATLCGINVYAYDFEVDGIFYKWMSKNQKTVMVAARIDYDYCDTFAGRVEIPPKVSFLDEEYTVAGIDANAFAGCIALEEVVIPSTVNYVSGFSGSSIAKVTISEGVKGINSNAFFDCDNLTSIEIPKGLKTIMDSAFTGCDNLKEVIVNEGLESIGNSTFQGCASLESMDLPSSFYSMGENAFNNSGIKKIGFAGEKKITIGDCAFFDTKLAEIDLSHVSTVGYMTFYRTKLESAHFGDNLISIGDMAFYGVPLKSVTFGSNVKSIGEYAFYKTDIETLNLSNASLLKDFGYAFAECKKLVSVKLPEGIKSICDGAFYGCSSLTEIILPECLEDIGCVAFANCSRLKTLDFPASLKNVHGGAFNNCTSLTSLEFPAKVWFHLWDYESIVDGCTSLKSVKLPGVPLPDASIFYNVDLETVTAVYGGDGYVPMNNGELFNEKTFDTAVLRVPTGTIDLYRSVWPWMLFDNIEEDSSIEMVGINKIQSDSKASIWYADGRLKHNFENSVDIEIFDVDGRLVLTKKSASESTDLSELHEGVYVVNAILNGKTETFKVVIP